MVHYITNRLLALIPILIFTSFVTFELVRLTPGDPTLILVGGRRTSPEVLQAIRHQYGLDRDPFSQYIYWCGKLLHGDLGESFRHKQKVSSLIGARLPLTIKLMCLSMTLALLLALPLGILSALHQNSWIDYVASLVALVGISSPVYFTGVIGMLTFGYWLRWLPTLGTGKGFGDELYHLILPASVLAFSLLALTARMTRAAMLDILDSDYIRTARAKGLPNHLLVVRHALRNALIPVVTVASLQLGFLFVGTVLVEFTFGLGGLGSLITDAIQNRDYPVVQGTTLVLVIVFVLLNLFTDLIYALLDPRIRYR
jgi:peptide/nickel transport system permease protein